MTLAIPYDPYWIERRLVQDIHSAVSRIGYDRITRRLTALYRELTTEDRMSVQHVKGLADIVRQTKEALAQATGAASQLQSSTQSVMDKVNQVNGMVAELKQADADLGAAIGTLSNGGPPGPLPDTVPAAPTSPGSSPQPQAQQQLQGAPDFDIHTRRDRPRV